MSDAELAELVARFRDLSEKVHGETGNDSSLESKPGSQSLKETAPKKTSRVGPKATRTMKTRSAQPKAKASQPDLQATSKPMAKKMTVPSQAIKGNLPWDTPKKTLQQHKADATKKVGAANLKIPQPKEGKQSAASPKEGGTSTKKSKVQGGKQDICSVCSQATASCGWENAQIHCLVVQIASEQGDLR